MNAWVPVQSSSVRALRHDPIGQTLDVEFQSGSYYRYHDVCFATYQEVLHAESVGRTLRLNVSLCKRYTRLSDQESV